MTKQEAMSELITGAILTHNTFTKKEWVKMHGGGEYIFEDGITCTPDEFWEYRKAAIFDDGWEIYNDKQMNKQEQLSRAILIATQAHAGQYDKDVKRMVKYHNAFMRLTEAKRSFKRR